MSSSGKEEYNILLLGETGSGKSTLINYLTNKFKNGTIANLKIAIPTKYHQTTENFQSSEKDLNDLSKSQTTESSIYNFEKDGQIFNFIDTPGLSATEGVEMDDEHIQNIMQATAKKDSLVAIIIVINGSQARATANVRNTLYRLKNSIPDIFLDNLVIAFTNCSAATVRFDLKQLQPWTIRAENVYHMDNSVLCAPVESWISNMRLKRRMESDWEDSMEEIEKLIQKLKQQGKKATVAFQQMRLKRAEIKKQLVEIFIQMKEFQVLQSQLDTLKTNEQESYFNYIKTKEIQTVNLGSSSSGWLDVFLHASITGAIAIACPMIGVAAKALIKGVIPRLTASAIAKAIPGVAAAVLPEPLIHAINSLLSAKKKTAEEILQEAERACNQVRKQISSVKDDVSLLDAALDAKGKQFQNRCEELRMLCHLFNFVDELQGILTVMVHEAHSLTSTKAREEAERRIDDIKSFINRLSKIK